MMVAGQKKCETQRRGKKPDQKAYHHDWSTDCRDTCKNWLSTVGITVVVRVMRMSAAPSMTMMRGDVRRHRRRHIHRTRSSVATCHRHPRHPHPRHPMHPIRWFKAISHLLRGGIASLRRIKCCHGFLLFCWWIAKEKKSSCEEPVNKGYEGGRKA